MTREKLNLVYGRRNSLDPFLIIPLTFRSVVKRFRDESCLRLGLALSTEYSNGNDPTGVWTTEYLPTKSTHSLVPVHSHTLRRIVVVWDPSLANDSFFVSLHALWGEGGRRRCLAEVGLSERVLRTN